MREMSEACRAIQNWIDGVYKLSQYSYNKKREFWSSENSAKVKIVVEKPDCDDLAECLLLVLEIVLRLRNNKPTQSQ